MHGGAPYLTMAEYVVSSLLRPDGTVQTTSQVTLDHLPNFINGNEMQLFVQTHGLVHQHNVQAHSSSRDVPALSSPTNVRAVRNQAIGRRSRSPGSRRSRPGSSSHRDHKGCLRMKRTGENGKAMVVAFMMIRGDTAACSPQGTREPD